MACLLCLDANEYAARGRVAAAQQKARRGVPPGRLGVVLVNMLFWKILVTRVNRKIVSQFAWYVSRRSFPLVPAKAGTQRSAVDSRHKRVYARLRRAMRGNERRLCCALSGTVPPAPYANPRWCG